MFGWNDVNAELIESVIEDAAAVVISLPPHDAPLSESVLAHWHAAETLLRNSTVACPLCVQLGASDSFVTRGAATSLSIRSRGNRWLKV